MLEQSHTQTGKTLLHILLEMPATQQHEQLILQFQANPPLRSFSSNQLLCYPAIHPPLLVHTLPSTLIQFISPPLTPTSVHDPLLHVPHFYSLHHLHSLHPTISPS